MPGAGPRFPQTLNCYLTARPPWTSWLKTTDFLAKSKTPRAESYLNKPSRRQAFKRGDRVFNRSLTLVLHRRHRTSPVELQARGPIRQPSKLVWVEGTTTKPSCNQTYEITMLFRRLQESSNKNYTFKMHAGSSGPLVIPLQAPPLHDVQKVSQASPNSLQPLHPKCMLHQPGPPLHAWLSMASQRAHTHRHSTASGHSFKGHSFKPK